jgi:two-component system NtrC family sensor kinase
MLESLLLDQTRTILLLVDPQSQAICEASGPTLRMLGYRREELLGRAITDIECALSDMFYWDEVRQGGQIEVSDTESSYLCADGEVLLALKTVRLVTADATAWLVIRAEPLASRKNVESELASITSRLQATLEATADGVLLVDRVGSIMNMNQSFSTMWGLPDAVLASRNDAEVFDFMAKMFHDPTVYLQQLAAIPPDSDQESFDTLSLADGRIFERKSKPAKHGEQIIGRVFSFSDVTERNAIGKQLLDQNIHLEEIVKQRTAALNQQLADLTEAKKRLEEAQSQLLQSEKLASIGQLAAGVAHELNNPIGFVNSNLGTLSGYVDSLLAIDAAYTAVQQLLSPTLPQAFDSVTTLKANADHAFMVEDLRQLIKESRDGLDRVKTIVRDLKDFARVGATEWLWADVHKGIDSTLNIVWNELKYKARVEREFGQLPEIHCIPSQLNQVFMNLLVNAAHAIETQGVIRVRSGCDDKQVWVEVIDDGAGIPPEILGRIFDPFFTTKPIGKGTGLGLSLAWGIVQRHQGRLEVQSELGKGTTFRVTLPIDAQPVNPPAHSTTSAPPRST